MITKFHLRCFVFCFFAASFLKCLIKSKLDTLLFLLMMVKQISADAPPPMKTGNDRLYIRGLEGTIWGEKTRAKKFFITFFLVNSMRTG